MNRNTLYAQVFVDELARSGLKAVCAAPGSRHAPLMLAFARHPEIKVYSHLDERSAAFFALGLALATDEPVAMICTSGSAAANFFPAVVEAHQSRVPLLVITADRPPELRYSGANQTMDQVKMFGDFVLWAMDANLPEAQPAALTMRALRTLAARAYATANGIRKGVVHINIPFRKPLEPIPVAGDADTVPAGAEARAEREPFTRMSRPAAPLPNAAEIAQLRQLVAEHPRGVILCGGRMRNDEAMAQALAAASRATGYPILAETYSGMRYNRHVHTLGAYESYMMLPEVPKPEVILRFGAVPTGTTLTNLILQSGATLVQIGASGMWMDDAHLTGLFIHADEAVVANALAAHDLRRAPSSLERLEAAVWEILASELRTGTYSDMAAAFDMLELLPDGTAVFAGNSLAVRHVDQFARPSQRDVQVYASRGVAGIDGNLSTALGIGAGRPGKPLVALVGDITFYHDMNGLLAVKRCGVPITIVLLNNDGGGIFNRLPIKDHDPEFTEYFITAHGLDFSHAAALYGLDYVRVTTRDEFRQTFAQCVRKPENSTIIEVRTDGKQDEARRQQLNEVIRAQLRGMLTPPA
jgi:2-succinyl-5-enolpyruvyl-6-hydroxy-3-cyclohexene-1-carboxylate synthase